jgi:hypothetical protein
MKVCRHLLAAAIALLAVESHAALPPPINVRVELQIVSITPAAALKLVPELMDEKTRRQRVPGCSRCSRAMKQNCSAGR